MGGEKPSSIMPELEKITIVRKLWRERKKIENEFKPKKK